MQIPVETKMWALKKYDTYQHLNIQDNCSHVEYKNGQCLQCDFKCEHLDYEDGYCLDCGEVMEIGEPDYDYDR